MHRPFFITTVVTTLAVASGCADSGTPAAPSPQIAAATTTSTVPAATPAPATPDIPTETTLRRATFVSANGYVTEGSARIQVANDEFTLELEQDFRTSNSAALDVRLCTDQGCTGDHAILGDLQRFGGRQSYPLADNGSDYNFVTIYCRAVRLPFGYGRLR